MFEAGSIHKINKVLYQYRRHPESIRREKQPYNEDWVVASTHIKKIVKEQHHDERDPVFLVIGNSNACKEFKQVCRISQLKVDCYLQSTDSDTPETIHQLFGKISLMESSNWKGYNISASFKLLRIKVCK
ncbi:hypothetical protein ACJROX_10945 [Pseudalkalibacillus sp. A8]|uniref:hypothetical protein n=1 Tax=Pseudalkalibacillus sp. A8 TaxID=3382641 RepID=UPI0038B46275